MLRLIMSLARNGKFSNINPIEKIFISIIPIIIMGFVKKPVVILINIIAMCFFHFLAKNNLKIVLKFTIEIGLFAAISSITFVFDYGIGYCVVILLKSINAGLCLSFFSMTTPFDDVLFYVAKVPYLRDICDIAKSMQRFIIIIEDELNILYISIKSRGGFETFKLTVNNTGKLAGLLFVNVLHRWKDIRNGIESRGYNGFMPYLDRKLSFSILRFLGILSYNTGIIFLNQIWR